MTELDRIALFVLLDLIGFSEPNFPMFSVSASTYVEIVNLSLRFDICLTDLNHYDCAE